jgi:5-methylcytosine-specific restriction endonuclease McrA
MCGLMNACETDHIQPLSLGGLDVTANTRLLCHDCHSEKTAREATAARAAQSGA